MLAERPLYVARLAGQVRMCVRASVVVCSPNDHLCTVLWHTPASTCHFARQCTRSARVSCVRIQGSGGRTTAIACPRAIIVIVVNATATATAAAARLQADKCSVDVLICCAVLRPLVSYCPTVRECDRP